MTLPEDLLEAERVRDRDGIFEAIGMATAPEVQRVRPMGSFSSAAERHRSDGRLRTGN